MTTALFLLRCLQIGLSLRDLDLLTIGMVNDVQINYRQKEGDCFVQSSFFTSRTPRNIPTKAGEEEGRNCCDEQNGSI